jgi:glycolate oxidase FAD binding subunit
VAVTQRAPTSAEFGLGAVTPRRVVTPASVEELAATLRECDAAGEAVVVVGGGTLQSLGHAPSRYDVALRTTALARILEYEYRDLTIAVEAGLTASALDETLAERGQFIPLDAPNAARSTVGGVLASGWLGPRRAKYGSPRDFVIGTTIVLADGVIAKAGGMVVKNSTGYDLSRFYCGSLGTLGVLVRANFKTLPSPEARRVALATLPERTRRRAMEHVAGLDVEPAAVLAIAGFADDIDGRDGLEGRIFLLFEGAVPSVDRATRQLRSALGAAGVPETTLFDAGAGKALARLIDAYVIRLGDRSVTYRSRGLPSDLFERTATIASLAQREALGLELIEDICTGDVIARVSTPVTGQLSERIGTFDPLLHASLPNVSVLTAPEALRGDLAMWGAPPSALEMMRAIKSRFDPNATLAPGRFVGKI